jgi:hypothetical protein
MLGFLIVSHFTAISSFEPFWVRTGLLGAVSCGWRDSVERGLAADAVSHLYQAAGKRLLAGGLASVSASSGTRFWL